jgi:phage terminase small subunit
LSLGPAAHDQYPEPQQPTKISRGDEVIWAQIETKIGASSTGLEEKSQAARQNALAN